MATKKKDEQRKKEEEERLAAAHKEFLDAFSDGPKLDRTWVRGGTDDSERRSNSSDNDTSKRKGNQGSRREIYKPTSKLAELASSFKTHEPLPKSEPASKPDVPKKKSSKMSNLERFKEELKAMQEERDERRRLRSHLKDCEQKGVTPTLLTSSGKPSRFEASREVIQTLESSIEKDIYGSSSKSTSFENDVTTTNIYCGNLSPKMTEQDLCEVFGKFGPLASIKIMYPRTEEERAKNRNTGFVGFMKRTDAEDAFDELKGETVMGFEMKLSWGKAIPIPPRPIFIPQSLVKETMPPPPSGLPFNAQPPEDWEPDHDRYGNPDLSKNLDNTEVQIVIPTDRLLLCLIHRMVEYVVREGPLFEAMIMNREMNNPRFRFLFDNQLPAHCYYRWKLFSILQGDEPHVWQTKPFQMFGGGSYWLPPKMNPYMQKQGKGSSDKPDSSSSGKRATLSERQRDRLEDLLREITTDRVKVGEAMVWCLEHAEAAEEIVEILTDSLGILETPLNKKLARLHIVSDILYNSSAKLPNVSYFRKYFEAALPTIFTRMHESYELIDGRLTAENFKQRIMSCFRVWEEWVIYPIDLLIKCQNVFLGLCQEDEEKEEDVEEDVDGQPISPSRDLLPTSNNGAGLVRADSNSNDEEDEEDIDGMPVTEAEDIDGQPIKAEEEPPKPKFAASKWETVDDEVVKAQAMTTSKWETLEDPSSRSTQSTGVAYDSEDSIDGMPIGDGGGGGADSSGEDDGDYKGSSGLSALSAAYTPKQKKTVLSMTEKRRSKLRDIEVKVVKYQDELEAGKRSRKSRMTVSEQVEAYRNKLLQKELEEAERDLMDERGTDRSERRRRHADRSRSSSPRRRSSRRSRSSSRNRRSRRSRSRTPKRSKRSRSRSSDRHRHKKYRN